MPDEKEQKGRKHVRWLSGCRAKNTGRVVSRLNGVSSRGNSIGPIFVSYPVLIFIFYIIFIFITNTLKFGKSGEIIREMIDWNYFFF